MSIVHIFSRSLSLSLSHTHTGDLVFLSFVFFLVLIWLHDLLWWFSIKNTKKNWGRENEFVKIGQIFYFLGRFGCLASKKRKRKTNRFCIYARQLNKTKQKNDNKIFTRKWKQNKTTKNVKNWIIQYSSGGGWWIFSLQFFRIFFQVKKGIFFLSLKVNKQ